MQAFKTTFSSSNPNISTTTAASSPVVPISQAQPPTIGIPLKDWESRVGQLSETQTALIVKLQKQFEHKTGLGSHLPSHDNVDSSYATSPRTNQIESVTSQTEMLSLDRIDNIGQFYTWYDQLDEDSMQEEKYRTRIERLNLYKEFCNHILQEIENSFNYLQTMEDKYNLVSKKTGEIHQACQNLLQVENQLVSFAERLSEKLNYFNELPKITSKLSSSTVAYDTEFKQLLTTLDQCIDFVLHNRDFKESETYLLKYRQLQNRALGLLKTDITASMKTTTSQILLSLKDVILDDSNVETYFYVKFRTLAPKLKPMIEEIEKRTAIKEYAVLLSDCETCYFQQRRLLLSNHITNNIMKLSQMHQADLCHMTRLGCVFIMNVCYNEYQLHQHFFANAGFGLSGLLETFANILYYAFRPLYIRNHNIEILCQLVYLLRTEILSDTVEQRGKSVEPFRVVVLRMLQDVQERLSFIVENFIRDEIEGYPPTESDLNYPAKLNTPTPSTEAPPEIPNQLPVPGSAFMPYKSLYQTWYPTLEKTLVCLSKLYLTVDARIFEELAAEAVRSCTLNILYASKRIQAKSTIDGQLFLIKHLITLREQITPFDVNFAIVEQNLDFTYLKNVWYQILQGPGSVLSWSSTNPFLQLIQTPGLEISQVDSKKDLERELKLAIESFIMSIIKSTMDPLISFLTKSSAFIGSKNQAALREQAFATPDKINLLLDELQASVTSKLDTLLAQIQLYITNQSTQLLLCRPVSDQTIDTVEQLRKIILVHYTEQDKEVIQLSKVDAIENLLRTRLLFTPTSIKGTASDSNNNGTAAPSVQPSNQ